MTVKNAREMHAARDPRALEACGWSRASVSDVDDSDQGEQQSRACPVPHAPMFDQAGVLMPAAYWPAGQTPL